MLNRIFIQGRLTKNPELRKTTGGVSVCSFTVAVERDRKSGGEKVTDFFEVVSWREQAEFVCNCFTKGKPIIIEGTMESRKWTDKNGQNRLSWEVHSNSVWFCDSPKTEPKDPLEEVTARFEEAEDDGELPF